MAVSYSVSYGVNITDFKEDSELMGNFSVRVEGTSIEFDVPIRIGL